MAKSNQSKPSDGPASSEFTGFANAPVNEDGSHVDFRDVEPFDAERDAALYEPSTIVDFKTPGTATNGAPMAQVPNPDFAVEDEPVDADDEPDADELEDEKPDDPATVIEESHREGPQETPTTAPAAEGKEAKESKGS